MRRCRIKLPNRCYHLISRVAHRAYFLDGDERTRLVDFVRRVAEFSGVKLLAYCVMSNHFHVFVYIGRPGYNLDQCGYPHVEEEILAPMDLIQRYQEERSSLNAEIDRVLAEITEKLGGAK